MADGPPLHVVSYCPEGQPRLKIKPRVKALFKPLVVAHIFYYLIDQNMAKPGVHTAGHQEWGSREE